MHLFSQRLSWLNAAIERLRAEGRIGRRGSTGDTALRLGHFFGTSAEFWLNLQKLYALRLVKKKGQQDEPVLADPLRTNTPAPETPLVGLSPSLPAGTFETPIAYAPHCPYRPASEPVNHPARPSAAGVCPKERGFATIRRPTGFQGLWRRETVLHLCNFDPLAHAYQPKTMTPSPRGYWREAG